MYSLLKACIIVRNMDTAEGRMNVFRSVLRNSRPIRYVHAVYEASPLAVKAALIVLYGLKCYLSLAWQYGRDQPLLFFASYPNERRVLDHMKSNLPEVHHGQVSILLRNCIHIRVITDTVNFLPNIFCIYRLSRRLARRYPFMPACRILSTVTFYMKFKSLISDRPIKAVFIACQYSPECLGLAAAAHRAGLRVLFTNHANATGETGYVPPIHADLVAVTSRAMADLYQRHSPSDLLVVEVPMDAPQSPITVPAEDRSGLVAGIYLTALTDEDRLRALVRDLARLPAISDVFIRTHPAEVVNADLSAVTTGGRPVEISRGRPLPDDIARTDIAICGNSTVAIEILRGGRPVLYDHRLDGLVYDYNGYVGQKLLPACPEHIDEAIFDQIREHYLDPDWTERMRYFDAGYQADEEAMLDRLQAAVVEIMDRAP